MARGFLSRQEDFFRSEVDLSDPSCCWQMVQIKTYLYVRKRIFFQHPSVVDPAICQFLNSAYFAGIYGVDAMAARLLPFPKTQSPAAGCSKSL